MSFNESFLLSVCPSVCHHAVFFPESVSFCLLYFLLPVLPFIYLSVYLFICLSVCGLRCLSILVFKGVFNAFNKQSRSYNDLKIQKYFLKIVRHFESKVLVFQFYLVNFKHMDLFSSFTNTY